jgi:hypothetical protein
VVPQLSYHLTSSVTVNGAPVSVDLPAAGLDWTGSPRFELGYRFPDSIGAVVGSFYNVTSQGTDSIAPFDAGGGAFLQSRLNMNVLDVDYVGANLCFAPLWDLQWRLGIRTAFIYADSQATGTFFSESSSDHFVGAGPHFGVEIIRALPKLPGFAVFGKLEGAVVIGQTSEHFQVTEHPPGDSSSFGDSRVTSGRSVPLLAFRTGISYSPPNYAPWIRFAFGYEVEEWWGMGNIAGNHVDLNVQGLFFRGEFRY